MVLVTVVLQNRAESRDVVANGDCHSHMIMCIDPPTLDINGHMTSKFSYSCHSACQSHRYERGMCVQSPGYCKEADTHWVCLCIGKVTEDVKEGTSNFSYE